MFCHQKEPSSSTIASPACTHVTVRWPVSDKPPCTTRSGVRKRWGRRCHRRRCHRRRGRGESPDVARPWYHRSTTAPWLLHARYSGGGTFSISFSRRRVVFCGDLPRLLSFFPSEGRSHRLDQRRRGLELFRHQFGLHGGWCGNMKGKEWTRVEWWARIGSGWGGGGVGWGMVRWGGRREGKGRGRVGGQLE